MTGAGDTGFQTAGARFVVDCNVKPMAFVGQVRTTLVFAELISNVG